MAYVPYCEKTKADTIELVFKEIEAGRSLVQICREDGMPDRDTVSRWIRESPQLTAGYAHARAMQAETLFGRMGDVEEAVSAGTMDSHAARVVLDSMRWRASKLAPKVYGDRLDVSVSDNRISIKGALEAANARLAHVIDVTPNAPAALVHSVQNVHDDQDD